MNLKYLFWFLALTFGITWGLAAAAILFPDTVAALTGEIGPANPLFIVSVYAPAISAVLLVLVRGGLPGLASFFRRLALWRAPAAWWLFLLAGIPLMVTAGAALNGSLAGGLPLASLSAALPALAAALFSGPVEELGWRGVALPLLQRRLSPFWAGLVLGCIWAVWHIPAFLLSGTVQSAWAFGPYLVGLVSVSLILTAFFNAARGSLLVAVLFHFQIMNPLLPDGQPWDMAFYVIAAVIVVWLNRAAMFRRGSGITAVEYPGGARRAQPAQLPDAAAI